MTFRLRLTAICTLLLTLCSGILRAEDPNIGIYEGALKRMGRPDHPARACVVGEGKDGGYRVMVQSELEDDTPATVEVTGMLKDGVVRFNSISGGATWIGEMQKGRLMLTFERGHYGTKFELNRIPAISHTAGKQPPAGAIVLLPYKEGTPANLDAWTNAKWKILPDGSVESVDGGNSTRQRFRDLTLHVEFWLPNRPEATSQLRSNSGVFLIGKYEVQILDSFGLVPGAGDCGAIYNTSAPAVNACLPPETWQAFDIDFRAPRLNADGSIQAPGRISVMLNGVQIQKDVELHYPTGSKTAANVAEGPISLQDKRHGIRFRNIWAMVTKP